MKTGRGFAAIGLHSPKDSMNVGSVLRAASCYGAAMVAATGARYSRSPTDPGASYKHIPLITCDDLRQVIPHGAVPVAVEILPGALSLPDYEHPESAFYVFGPEDGSLGSKVVDWCRDVIYVPTRHCMNLAATVNVVLYDRNAKRIRTKNRNEAASD
jgi:tRNA(Leu) C34 or U34 (ribose-2'-O)-methylase TrmL